MKFLATLTLLALGAISHAADWKPDDIHPKVFQMVACWISDSTEPVVTEINLDAVRSNRNQFDYDGMKKESDWVTFREGREMLRFKIVSSKAGEHTILYQENGGGTLTTQRVIRFAIIPRSLNIDGEKRTVAVLRILSIATKE